MRALHEVVQAGKVRHIGASSMYAWQFAKARHIAGPAGPGSRRCRTMTTWVYREETREMIPRCAWIRARDIPWRALARAARRYP